MDRPKPWLRYIRASATSQRALALATMRVRNGEGDELGIVDGLVVDSGSGRTLYVVVDAGWFTSRHVLIPIGHVDLDSSRDVLRVSITKEQIGRFPGFDVGRFDELTTNDIQRVDHPLIDREKLRACGRRDSATNTPIKKTRERARTRERS